MDGQETAGKMQKAEGYTAYYAAKKTYSTGDSLVVTDPTTSPAISGLSMGEQTGSRVLHYLWPYVIEMGWGLGNIENFWGICVYDFDFGF